jgi:uncharacterized RDD family membrane protein YckC
MEELARRPATTFFVGLLTKLVAPLAILLLAVTGIGIFVIPFLVAALLLAAVLGKIALATWIGGGLGRPFGASLRPVPAFAVGSLVILVLYIVPVVGLVALAILSVWGLGAAVTASLAGLRREMPEKVATPPAPPASGPIPPEPVSKAAPAFSGSGAVLYAAAPGETESVPGAETPRFPAADTGSGESGATPAPMPVRPTEPPVMMPEAYAYPRASFWERMGAAFLDIVLVSILSSLVGGLPLGLLVALAYFAGMWAWRGTTIGGIVLGLKVVRYDGQPVTFAVALVRSLSSALSTIVLFLGFFAIAWDADRQGWHDKIAGTIVLKQPRGTPLVCL